MKSNLKSYSKMAGLLLASIYLSSCITTQSPTKSKWEELLASDEFQEEKKIYHQRMGDLDFCWSVGVNDFLSNSNIKPNKDCIYFSSNVTADYNDQFIRKKVIYQAIRKLKVMQVTDIGFLIKSPSYSDDQLIFVFKNKEQELVVDGSYLDNSHNWIMYKYIGPYQYTSLTGIRTVHSFKIMSPEELNHPTKGFKSYNPFKEFFIKNQVWDWLDKNK